MAKISGVIRGDSHTINLTITDGGSPVNLTGYTVFFTVNADKDPVSDSAAAIEKDITSFISPTSGEATIELDPADTNSLEPGGYWYDIQLKDGSGNITSFPKDRFTIVSDITRRTT
jgi:hypothetical protein